MHVRHTFSQVGAKRKLAISSCQCTQKSPVCSEDGWKLIFAGSQFTNNAESYYSPTECEALALSWGLKHSRIFTLECPNLLLPPTTNHSSASSMTETWGAFSIHGFRTSKKGCCPGASVLAIALASGPRVQMPCHDTLEYLNSSSNCL